MPYLIVYILAAVLVGVFADHRGRSGIVWGLVAVAVSPLIAFVVLLCIEPKRTKVSKELRELQAIRRELASLKQPAVTNPVPPPRYQTEEERMLAEVQAEERRKAEEMRQRL